METFAERFDVASGARTKFEPEQILLQDPANWIAGAHLEVWETTGGSELPETELYLHGIVVTNNVVPTEVRFAGGPPIAGGSVPGCVAILPAGIPYSGVGRGPARTTVFGLRTEVLAAAVRTRGARRVELKPAYGIVDTFIGEAIGVLAADVRDGCPMGSLYGDSIIAAIAAHLIRHYSADPRVDQVNLKSDNVRRERIRQHILDQLGSSLTLQDMAAALGLDLYSFSRWFKESFGVSPHQYVLEARIDRARRLLNTTALSLVDVALDCGFSSQSHLTSVFKRFMGTTPAAFRMLGGGHSD